MTYIIPIALIFIYATTITLIFNKRIEQTIPIGMVELVIIIYLFGIFDNLNLGVIITEILAVIQVFIIIYIMCRERDSKKIKEKIEMIITPGAVIYIVLCTIAIFSNKGRMFENHDEFTHWGKLVKNMFMYNTYGTNAESVLTFNEYPPFTGTFQYLFVTIKNIFSETVIINAQCIMYLSIVIPMTKNIEWDKNIKNAIWIVPTMICIPMIFYSNFYVEIMVDGILGIMFGFCIFYAYQEEKPIFKSINIGTMLIMMALTKTSGIALAILAIVIIVIKNIINIKQVKAKKELKDIIICAIIVTILTTIWYMKVRNTVKTWNFENYITTDDTNNVNTENVVRAYMKSIFGSGLITEKNLTTFNVILILLCSSMYISKKMKEKQNNRYYLVAMLISIIVYLIAMCVSYIRIFNKDEAETLSCFERYISTILLANVMFQVLLLVDMKEKIQAKKIIVILTILITLMPLYNIKEKYIYKEKYMERSNEFREEYTKIKIFKDYLKPTDRILYIIDAKYNIKYIIVMNNYELMPVQLNRVVGSMFSTKEEFENLVKQYDYVYIYKIKNRDAEVIRSDFINSRVDEDALYKVEIEDERITLKRKVLKNN